ncbi:protein kinase domain-containing protein [Bacillus cereus group sp. TH228LC]|uniref:protein kinase domain-containing protein n=1 Tax=Bacillus cereus group sp. TH228LC TaxID=3018049 RepID=UPI0022E1DE1C|nr:protein kinase [Bacillus cereus group sp. TH228LC]MDA1580525.1 protein kinase [Bacillus cereus group sp. TH228LC]
MSFQRYEIQRVLDNQGGMGITALGYDHNLKRDVVIKKLNTNNINSPEQIQLFNNQLRQEAVNQANLAHNNIAQIFDYYEQDDLGHIVMEYVKGDSLDQFEYLINVKQEKEDIERALNIIFQIIEGLLFAHKNGIVHRDIKLNNIMYDEENGVIKIIDFGLSKPTEVNRNETVYFARTPGYVPKELGELLRGQRETIDDYKRDIYCLGLVIYTILTGTMPYEGADNYSVSTPRISEFRNDVSEELNELFYSMIAVEPEDRLGNLELVLEAIRKQLRQGYSPLVKMPNIKYHTKIRDPIHGYIKLSQDEVKLINNRFFQRLRNVKQLGTTYLVYPCAIHSRFEHSLGVMHVATKLFDEIASKNNDLLEWDEEEIRKQRQMLRLVALLHDVGHAPFSHVSDNLFSDDVKNHENMSAKIIRESELKDLVNNIGENHGNFNHNEIAGLIEGKYLAKYSLIKQIFSGNVIDADRMDYLLRDSYMAGVNYGTYDIEHLIRSVDIDFNYGKPILAIKHKGLYVLEEFILARYYMFNQVYYHKTRRVYDKILEKCIQNYLKANEISKLPSDINKFIELDDHKIMSYINNYSSDIWNKMFCRRNHYRTVYEIFPDASNQEKEEIIKIKQNLLSSNIPKGKFIIDEYYKPPVVYRDEEGHPMFGLVDKNKNSLFIDEKSHVLKNMNKGTYIFRIYVDSEYEDAVLQNIREVAIC